MKILQRILMLALVFWLAACSQAGLPSAASPLAPTDAAADRPGLGTAWGETVSSVTHSVKFERADNNTPDDITAIYYNDTIKSNAGDSRASLSMASGAINLRFRDGNNNTLNLLRGGNGRWNIVGKAGDHYEMVLYNKSRAPYEVVSSVDGLDVISGRPGSYHTGGYILYPGKTLVIDGFRKNEREVAAFRFSSVPHSYVANTSNGDVANVGVIGVALFAEKDSEAAIRMKANPFPQNTQSDSRFAPPPDSIP
ncbi:hypothetical protein FNZ07_17630 [Paraburkholderia megapolitana]|uniref:Outer membrane lipoprotein n=2 Tax=Paraburkholderia megapolitana TaxID=420953 RepID=A0A1I3GT28_9BURK|nr:hypothetical protein FNZ07_17630 [Paraburkholderia megapolitana]SFI26594.1 hypothetical protein SAMN05192543_102676 [Paraburkholderia megapolitana]